MPSTRARIRAILMAPLLLATPLITSAGSAHAVSTVGACIASVTLNFSPPATNTAPPGPATTSTGSGTITTCAVADGGATTGTFTYALTGNLTCLSASNIAGTLDIAWTGGASSHATVTGLVTTAGSAGGAAGLTATITIGRFTGDTITIANVRDPLALLSCLTTGLSQATGTTSLTFTNPA